MSPHFCVLVVDDDPDTVETAAEILSIHGFRVLTAAGGGEAFQLAAANLPDVVLSDLAMPRGDGYELARRLRDAGGKPPVLVAVTGRATERDRCRATEAGFDLHLAKPVDPAVIVGLVKRIRDSIDAAAVPGEWGRAVG
jgi:CheY-like chemotaxis protein